jgi:hypothetical protein
MKNSIQLSLDKRVVTLFLSTLIGVGGVAYNVKSTAQTTASAIPTGGTCALLLTLPVPYGVTVSSYQTGYNFIGQITFLSATTAKFSGRGVNPTFNKDDSPYIAADGVGILDLNDWNVTITPMTSTNGFGGGYLLNFSGSALGGQKNFSLTGVPANNGKTIMLVSTGNGTASNPGLGPGSGLCQV